MSDEQQVLVRLPAPMYRALKMECAMMGVSVSSVIRQLIVKWLPDDYEHCYESQSPFGLPDNIQAGPLQGK